MRKYLSLLVLFTMLISCSKELSQETVLGSWTLKEIASSGFMSDSIQRIESYQDLGDGCGILSIKDKTEQYEITFETQACSIITLREDYSGEITSGKPDELEAVSVTYTLEEGDNIITICADASSCVDYICENDKLYLTLQIATVDMKNEDYQRTFCYERE
ncbi:MAG: hypothetical protein HKN09_08085 [Saprospiraceae bacterium]|nr:hypothetical protein [Saprospiraceae bacterium]